MIWALGSLLREGLGRDCAEGVRPRRGPGRQWVRPAWGRQRSELGEQWWACQDLNLGPHPYQAYSRDAFKQLDREAASSPVGWQ
jgi:hypothetical protein